jgi:hypothetical protein
MYMYSDKVDGRQEKMHERELELLRWRKGVRAVTLAQRKRQIRICDLIVGKEK